MSDNIAERSENLEKDSKTSRWDFLKQQVSRLGGRAKRVVSSAREENIQREIIQVTTSRPVIVVPENSGLAQLINRMDETGNGLSANRIKYLYPDFINYLNKNLSRKYNEKVLKQISNALSSGNKEIIEMFSRILSDQYSQQIKANRDKQKGVTGRLSEPLEAMNAIGIKKREAEVLASEMSVGILREEQRSSRAEFASLHSDWKIVLAEPKRLKDVDFNREMAGVVLDPDQPAKLVSGDLHK